MNKDELEVIEIIQTRLEFIKAVIDSADKTVKVIQAELEMLKSLEAEK